MSLNSNIIGSCAVVLVILCCVVWCKRNCFKLNKEEVDPTKRHILLRRSLALGTWGNHLEFVHRKDSTRVYKLTNVVENASEIRELKMQVTMERLEENSDGCGDDEVSAKEYFMLEADAFVAEFDLTCNILHEKVLFVQVLTE